MFFPLDPLHLGLYRTRSPNLPSYPAYTLSTPSADHLEEGSWTGSGFEFGGASVLLFSSFLKSHEHS
jgi:hypothetical protein